MRTRTNTLSNVVLRYLLDGIVEGRFTPGQRLKEQDIAKALNLSRSPIREATKMLENEGLVIAEPWNGLVIASLSRMEMLEIFTYREALEGLAAELASQAITEDELDRLDHLVAQMRRSTDATPAELVANNKEFHQLIYEAAHNPYLLESAGMLRVFLALLPGSNYDKPGRREMIAQEHGDIVESLRRRNASTAKEVACTHVRNSTNAQMSFILLNEIT